VDRVRRILSACLAAVLVGMSPGCQSNAPKTAPVQGRVVFRSGQPLANANIQFLPLEESGTGAILIANGASDQNGAFKLQTYLNETRTALDGAVPGKYKVVVTAYPGGPMVQAKYGSPSDTPLRVEIPVVGNPALTLGVEAGP
jgi:hypothetical protein